MLKKKIVEVFIKILDEIIKRKKQIKNKQTSKLKKYEKNQIWKERKKESEEKEVKK